MSAPRAGPEEVRLKLRANGYCPLPVNGKRPHITGWQTLTDVTEQEIHLWSRMRPAEENTGVLTARTPFADIDILNPDAADAVEQLVREFYEEKGRILVRFGNRPKRAIPFRTDAPFAKILVKFETADGAPEEKIEFLCDGQQCVVHGVHPDTRVAYSWHGGSLDEIKREELPYIHAEEAQELVNAIVALLTGRFGYRVREQTKKKVNDADDDAGPADWSAGPADLMDHDRLAALAMRFARSGMAAGALFNFLRTALSNLPGIDEERRQRRVRELRGIVDSAVGKIEAESRPAATPAPLGQVVAVFHECLALKDDDPIYVTLGTVAANLLPSRDPTWLGLIGPPSAAKTELLNSLSRLPYVHTVETFTGPGLLSGTPKKEKTAGATGGVLRKIGAFGIMLFKDFGSVIELRHEQRGEMMAALRRIYDGQYTRTLGTEGGRTYTWTGRAGLLFGATQAYDSHHAVGGTLGDRFLLFRVASMPKEQLEMCHLRPGAPTDMRARLAAAVAGLFASLPDPPPEPERMTDDEYAALSKAISRVIKLRGGVMRDRIHRDIEDVLDPEGPARLALALQQLFAGLCFIGVDRAKGAALVEQVAYDSAPKLRLRALRALTDQWQTTRDVANAIKLPTTSTKHALEELMVQGLALRDEAGEQQDKDDLFDKGTKGRSGVHRWKLPPLNPQYTSHGYIEPEILLEEFVG